MNFSLVIGTVLGGIALHSQLAGNGCNPALSLIITMVAVALVIWIGSCLLEHSAKDDTKKSNDDTTIR